MSIPSLVSAALLSLSSLLPSTAASAAPIAFAQEDGGELDIVIEMFAAPHFELSIDEAWCAYADGALVVKQVGDHHYLVTYGDGILDVLIDESDF